MSLAVTAQQKSLDEITEFRIKNSGAFIDKDKDVDGYYFYYEVDKLKKGQREYAIKMLDNNLNEIATKSYIDQKNTYLAESKFNNQALMFAMVNKKEENFKLITFDRKGAQGNEIIIPINKKEFRWVEMMEKSGNFNLLFPVDNKGFLFNYIRDNKKIGYGLKYVATDGGKSWDYNSPDEAKEILIINPIEANEKVVVALEMSKKSILSQTIDFKVVVLDIENGNVLFTREFDRDENPRLITNAFLNKDGNLILLGEYFEKGDNIIKADSKGIFAKITDLNGNDLSDNKVSWEDKIDAMMPPDSDGKTRNNTYVYFHDMILTQDGSYYCIGEKYRKTANALGILGLTGNANGQRSYTQLTITDAVFFKFDKEFNLKDIEVFEKGKSRIPSLTDFGSPQMNAHALKVYGAFDYEFTQIDTNRDRFYANFIDYERLKGESNKLAFKTVMYSDGELSEDKIYLKKDSGKIDFRVLPAKLGHVMLVEYSRRDKTLDLHLEKLNIQ